MNTIAAQPPYQTAERATALHQRLFIADARRRAHMESQPIAPLRLHIDMPRLQEGRVGLRHAA